MILILIIYTNGFNAYTELLTYKQLKRQLFRLQKYFFL